MEGKQAKILLVDDDADFITATKMVLETKYDVIIATEGEDGIAKAKSENPDLIILDVIMPIKDGFSAAEQLKKDSKLSEIPIIMLTSYAQHKSSTNIPVSKGMTLEAEDYIDKPVKPEELLKRVSALLEKV